MAEPISQLMAEIAAGDSLTLAQAAAITPGYRKGTKANRSRFWRYIREGFERKDGRVVKLEAVQLGSQLLTSRAALDRFAAAIAAPSVGAAPAEQPKARTPAERKRAGEAAVAKLAKAGA